LTIFSKNATVIRSFTKEFIAKEPFGSRIPLVWCSDIPPISAYAEPTECATKATLATFRRALRKTRFGA
jgi:hypothetical protein